MVRSSLKSNVTKREEASCVPAPMFVDRAALPQAEGASALRVVLMPHFRQTNNQKSIRSPIIRRSSSRIPLRSPQPTGTCVAQGLGTEVLYEHREMGSVSRA